MTFQLNAMDENGVKSYMKKYIETKLKSPVKKIDVISSYSLDKLPGWEIYFLAMKVKVKMGNDYREAIVPQTVFTKGDKITLKLMSRKGEDYAKLLKPKVPNRAYDDAHFILGSKDAPHKILVFSDPFCYFCQEKIPEIINLVKANPRTYGLYYYHLPLLNIHPAADVTTKAMHVFQKRGEIDKMFALYDLFIEPTETNTHKILKAIKDKTGVMLSKAEIENEEIKDALRTDMAMKRKLMVTGTPTIFFDGKWDKSRKAYKQYAR